ncbi:MAG TPA: DinB family protein [Paludibacter sp.]
MNSFDSNNSKLLELLEVWEPRLLALTEEVISNRHNSQNRTIKQIVGHMIDSASNNTHRIVHLQYQIIPLVFPDYANLGNNDRWIAIQNYQDENWTDLVQLWKFTNLHIVHVINNVNPVKLDNTWLSALNEEVSLRNMIVSYLSHFELHLREIETLINQK